MQVRKIAILVLSIFALPVMVLAAGSNPELPDPQMTPGAINPDVTQSNIHQTICVKGYTKTIRPPASYTNKLKRNQMRAYGMGNASPKSTEEDHLISLELGGHPSDPRNLWPQPWHTEWNAGQKDELENRLHQLVCSHKIPLSEAQQAIATNWIKAYQRYVGR